LEFWPVPRLPEPVLIDKIVTKVRKLNFSAWLKITKDLWVLDTVKNGYQIEFNVFPQGSSLLW
jgi:hypothetical protein